MSVAGDQVKSVRQLLAVVATLALAYVCMRTLRFTNDALNLLFLGGFFVTPFLALRPVLRLHRWPKVLTTILLTPVLVISALGLLSMATCDVPAHIEHRELSRELCTVSQRQYSVHLVWKETAGGAVGPHGVSLQQRRFVVPGLYLVKHLDYFEGALAGSISADGVDKIRLHIPERDQQAPVDRVYSLKQWVYF